MYAGSLFSHKTYLGTSPFLDQGVPNICGFLPITLHYVFLWHLSVSIHMLFRQSEHCYCINIFGLIKHFLLVFAYRKPQLTSSLLTSIWPLHSLQFVGQLWRREQSNDQMDVEVVYIPEVAGFYFLVYFAHQTDSGRGRYFSSTFFFIF